ncbi:hypothetical protein [Catenuloplanes atrovinosus]|uniref:FXSXX-COOH protein n=1 Tax=Catenuloplanes atrovinosus TaxID=137266 RepID=A0AAE3YLC7_9ACTN|nr:hypothetical protein [Catenuloplanes atrovinosus]MDR7274338.1 hypothetical protein [Catenuloplanes atrovinosus]
MTHRPGDVITELIDLSDCTLRDLRLKDDLVPAAAVRRALRQVERPRANLGGSGPPGRAD